MLYCFLVLFIVILFFFFFKQKTAYELRISDWSSDVCSSDLTVLGTKFSVRRDGDKVSVSVLEGRVRIDDVQTQLETGNSSATITGGVLAVTNGPSTLVTQRAPDRVADALARSEEHTSELKSLMRISYAVFCLQKKKTKART